MCVSVVVDYADTRFLGISSQKRKSSRNRFCYLYGAQVESFKKKEKYGQKSRDTVPLRHFLRRINI